MPMSILLSGVHSTETTTRDNLGFNKCTEIKTSSESKEERFLYDILRRSLGEGLSTQILPKDVLSSTKNLDEIISTPFRLVSWKNSPRNISLIPKHYSSVPVQWPIEDTTNETRARHIHAKKAAVDAMSLTSGLSAGKNLPSRTVATVRPNEFTGGFPNMFVTEKVIPRITGEVRSDGDIMGVRCCPIIPVQETKGEASRKKRRRKRNPVNKHRLPPAFFRPLDSWGGKSAGYAMGWQGSWPVRHAGPQSYVRDTMRRAVLSTLK